MYFSRLLRHNIVIYFCDNATGDISFGVTLANDSWRKGFILYMGIFRIGLIKTAEYNSRGN